MRWRMVLTVVLAGALAMTAEAQWGTALPGEDPQSWPRLGACALEGIGAVGAGALIAALPAYGTLKTGANHFLGIGPEVLVLGCVTVAAHSMGSWLGAGLVGRALGWEGNQGLSYSLALVPTPIALGVLIAGMRAGSTPLLYTSAAIFVAGTPILATVGYNIGAVREGYGNRFLAPSVAARIESLREAPRQYDVALDVKLLTVRF